MHMSLGYPLVILTYWNLIHTHTYIRIYIIYYNIYIWPCLVKILTFCKVSPDERSIQCSWYNINWLQNTSHSSLWGNWGGVFLANVIPPHRDVSTCLQAQPTEGRLTTLLDPLVGHVAVVGHTCLLREVYCFTKKIIQIWRVPLLKYHLWYSLVEFNRWKHPASFWVQGISNIFSFTDELTVKHFKTPRLYVTVKVL